MQNAPVVKVALTAVVVMVGVVFFVKSTAGSAQHYKMVDELFAAGDLGQWHDTEMKIHGNVVSATIKERVVDQETLRTFVLHKGGKRIRVFSKGPKPDTFKDESEVVATGRIVPAAQMAKAFAALDTHREAETKYVLDASELMAKCPSHYGEAQANKRLAGSGDN